MRTSVAAAALLLLAVPVAAQAPPRPTITEVRFNDRAVVRAPEGASLLIVGAGLHACPGTGSCDHPGLKVTFQGVPLFVSSASPEAICASVVERVPLGKGKLVVEQAGRPDASIDFELLTRKAFGELPGEGRQPGAQAGPDAGELLRARFTCTRFEVVRDAEGVRFEAEGKAPLQGGRLALALAFDKRRLATEGSSQAAEVDAQGVWRARFGPFSKLVPVGPWTLIYTFELPRQARGVKSDLQGRLTSVELAALERVEKHEEVLPDEAAAGEQAAALQAQAQALAEAAAGLLADVEAAFASGCRVYYRQASGAGFDQAEHAKYVATLGLSPERTKAAADDWRFSTRTGHFKPDEWLAWGETALLPALRARLEALREARAAWLVSPNAQADVAADALLGVLARTFEARTRALHERAKVAVPARLALGAEVASVEAVSRAAFEQHRRELLRAVGLDAK